MSHPGGVLLTQQFRTNPAQRQTNVRAACRHCSQAVLGSYQCISERVFEEKIMAVKALGNGREQQGQLGLRVDDAVAARRAQMRRRAGLRVVPPAPDLPPEDAQQRAADFARRTKFTSPAAPAHVARPPAPVSTPERRGDRKSTRLNSSHVASSYA